MSGVGGLDIGEPSEPPVNSDKDVPDSGEIGFYYIASTTVTTSSFITPTTSMSTSSKTVTEHHALSLRLIKPMLLISHKPTRIAICHASFTH